MKKEKFDSFLSGKLIDLIILDQKIVKSTDWYKWLNFKKNTDYLEVENFPILLKIKFSTLKIIFI